METLLRKLCRTRNSGVQATRGSLPLVVVGTQSSQVTATILPPLQGLSSSAGLYLILLALRVCRLRQVSRTTKEFLEHTAVNRADLKSTDKNSKQIRRLRFNSRLAAVHGAFSNRPRVISRGRGCTLVRRRNNSRLSVPRSRTRVAHTRGAGRARWYEVSSRASFPPH